MEQKTSIVNQLNDIFSKILLVLENAINYCR